MSEFLGGIAVLAFLAVVFSLLIPGMRPKDGRFRSGRRPMRTLRDVTKAGAADDAGAWVTTFIGLLALASLISPGQTSAASTGATLGVACGLMALGESTSRIRDVGLSVLGLVAAFAGVVQLLDPGVCGVATSTRLLTLGLVLLAFGLGIAIALLKFSVSATVGLQAFVAVEIATFLTAPWGVDFVGGSQLVALAAAVAIGLLVGVSPRLFLSLFGIGIGVVTIWISTLTTTGCGFDGSSSGVVTLAAGMVTYLLTAVAVGRFRR